MKTLSMNHCRPRGGAGIQIAGKTLPLSTRTVALLEVALQGDLLSEALGGMRATFVHHCALADGTREAVHLGFGVLALTELPEVLEAFIRIHNEYADGSVISGPSGGDDAPDCTESEWEQIEREAGDAKWRQWNAELLRTVGARYFQNCQVQTHSPELARTPEKLISILIEKMESTAVYFPFLLGDNGDITVLSFDAEKGQRIRDKAAQVEARVGEIYEAQKALYRNENNFPIPISDEE